ncbi:MAG: hypothetical protein ACLP50_14945 [Solirubrobacteraceae bacterium]
MEIWSEHGLKIVTAFAVLLVIAVVGSVAQGGGGSASRNPAGAPGVRATTTPSPGSHAYEDSDESGPQVRRIPVSASQQPAVRAAALRFMAWYLPFSYGQRSSAPIANLTASEREDLQSNPPQVPPAVSRRHARTLGVVLTPYASGEWKAAVRVSDGTVTYTVPLILGDLPAGWEVMAIQE